MSFWVRSSPRASKNFSIVLGVAALGCPHQPAGIVIDHAGEIPLSLAVGDFVDPDAAQPGQQVGLAGPLGHDPFHDGLHGPPGGAQELPTVEDAARAVHHATVPSKA